MNKTTGICKLLIFALALASSSAFAAKHPAKVSHRNYNTQTPLHATPHFEVLAAGSVSALDAGNLSLSVTTSETDLLVQTNENSWTSWGGQLGVGYDYPLFNALSYSDHVQWFTAIEPQLNVYYSTYRNEGDVYRFGNAAFNDLNYNMLIHSTRLMFDVALTVAEWKRFSVYGIVGIGNAWNDISYSDSTNAGLPCSLQSISSSSNNNVGDFVWEAGAGLEYKLTNRLELSLEYLYTDFGSQDFDGNKVSTTLTRPNFDPSFSMRTQGVLFGVHVAI
jgi:outer membrane autotransporter protein